MNANTNFPDTMISVALDRQASRVRAVQAYGNSRTGAAVDQYSADRAPREAWPAVLMGRALVVGVILIGALVGLLALAV